MPRGRRHFRHRFDPSFGQSYVMPEKSVEDAKVEAALEDATENEETVEVWKSYECKSLDFGSPHPGDIVEAASLSAVNLPAHTYPLQNSLRRQIEDGTLSSMQLEGIMFACERHSRYLPDGRRAGFFVGDSAGVGKGRQMAGIILDNLLRGRKRHVWFSASKDLHLDATRDLRDIGCCVQVFDSVGSLGRKLKSTSVTEAVVFCTYTELTSTGSRETGLSRYEELLRWLCGGSSLDSRTKFDGVLVFDECHKAKNYFEGKAEKNSTKAGTSVVRLQEDLPNARVVYSSATGISAVENMGYMARMGLWGEGTSFPSFDRFSAAIGGGKSVAALEMLALEFKATGCQVARNVGYHGAEFSTVSANLSPNDARMYRAAAELWHDVAEQMAKAHELCKKTPNNEYRQTRPTASKGFEGNSVKMFWSSHQRFMRQLVASLKVPALAHVANESLKAGHCVVIGLQTTGEAALGRALEDELEEYGVSSEDAEIDALNGDEEYVVPKQRPPKRSAGKTGKLLSSQNGDLVSVCKSILKSFLLKWFPTKQTWLPASTDPKSVPYLPDRNDLCVELWLICRDVPNLDSKMFIPQIMKYLVTDKVDNTKSRVKFPAYDEDGTVIECKRMQSRLLARLNNVYLPPSALDDLIDRLGGPKEVAEMTGRGIRQVRLDDGSVVIQSRVRAVSRAKGTKDDLASWGDTAKASLNVQERGSFMRGDKLVAIISEAASTGISLHADRTAQNQRRRVHCTLELPWAADQAIQQLGRSHRTNQSSAPIFRLLSSGLGGEHRFISSVSRRLQSLGALTQGDRRASVGAMTFGEFQFESDHGRNALKVLYDSIMKRTLPPNVDWKDIVQQSLEHLKLDNGEAVDAKSDESSIPNETSSDLTQSFTWCPPANPRMATEGQFFDALEEAAKFTGGLKHTTEPLADPTLSVGRRRFYGYASASSRSTPSPTPGPRRLVPIDAKSFSQNIIKDVPRFFNRILGLPFGQQALLFNYFNALLEEDIKEAKRNGKYDRGVQILDGQNISRVKEPELIYRDPGTGGKLMIHALMRDRGVPLKDVIRELRYRNAVMYDPSVKREDFPIIDPPTPQSLAVALNEAAENGAFFRSNKEIFGRKRTCLALRLGATQWKIIRPGTGIFSASQMTDEVLQRNYHVVTNFEKLRKYWDDEFGWSEKECTHGPRCKHGSLCTVGRRKFETNILTGNVISLWSSLETVISNVLSLPKSERALSIVQTNITETRERVVGVIWPLAAVSALREMVGKMKDGHDFDRRAVIIRTLPVKNLKQRPSGDLLMDYEFRDKYFELDLQYQAWINSRFTPVEQLSMIGFSLNDKGEVDAVDEVASAKGVTKGYKLHRVGMTTITDPARLPYDLKSLIVAGARLREDKTRYLQECTFLRPRTTQDDLDEERLWREGLASEPATPVDGDAVARLVMDPKLLRPQVESVQEAPSGKKRSSGFQPSSKKKRIVAAIEESDEEMEATNVSDDSVDVEQNSSKVKTKMVASSRGNSSRSSRPARSKKLDYSKIDSPELPGGESESDNAENSVGDVSDQEE